MYPSSISSRISSAWNAFWYPAPKCWSFILFSIDHAAILKSINDNQLRSALQEIEPKRYLGLINYSGRSARNNTNKTVSFTLIPLSRGIPAQLHDTFRPKHPENHPIDDIEPLETSKPFPLPNIYFDFHSPRQAVKVSYTEKIPGNATMLSGRSPSQVIRSDTRIIMDKLRNRNSSSEEHGNGARFVLPITDISYNFSKEEFSGLSDFLEEAARLKRVIKEAKARRPERTRLELPAIWTYFIASALKWL
ncbi:hypothetical protein BDN72DRAFT_839393 [Pluteus cervinus]|uniref:Uncharacterized protein n=1 Tax=Pluteus cervinus TaxID=181527 RepID=A0ACD3AY23_9AGAR|nr:hypothetical protein BDN72DRAFT_839393 [Pluteus cervinus]